MYPDLSGLIYLAVLGMAVLLVIIFPSVGGLLTLSGCRLITGNWMPICGYAGAIIGLIPASLFAYEMLKSLIQGHRNDR